MIIEVTCSCGKTTGIHFPETSASCTNCSILRAELAEAKKENRRLQRALSENAIAVFEYVAGR